MKYLIIYGWSEAGNSEEKCRVFLDEKNKKLVFKGKAKEVALVKKIFKGFENTIRDSRDKIPKGDVERFFYALPEYMSRLSYIAASKIFEEKGGHRK